MAQLLSVVQRHTELPPQYRRPENDRPRLHQVLGGINIPAVDLGSADKSSVVSQISNACSTYGFFQVYNHGVDKGLIRRMRAVSREFFALSPEEKKKLYSADPTKKVRLSTSFNVPKETIHNWRDFLRLHCYPLETYVPEWPANPPSFRDIVSSYCREVRELGFRLQGLISESLGLETKYIQEVCGEQEQHMAINYYPPCPEPEMTFGLPAHTDPNALTILLQDEQVAGLQVLKDDKWIRVDPNPDSFVINIGDQLQALSNGRYRSVWHRAVVNADCERMSIASFLSPCYTALISPAEKLVADGQQAVYRSYTYEEYYKKFWSRNLDDDHCLELFKNLGQILEKHTSVSSLSQRFAICKRVVGSRYEGEMWLSEFIVEFLEASEIGGKLMFWGMNLDKAPRWRGWVNCGPVGLYHADLRHVHQDLHWRIVVYAMHLQI